MEDATNTTGGKTASARNEFIVVYSMIGAAITVFLLGMILPANSLFFGVNVNYYARLLTGIAGVLLGEALFMYKVMKRKGGAR